MISEKDVVEALPRNPGSFLSHFVAYGFACTDAHLAFHLAAGLATIAQTCPIELNFPFGSPVFSNVYALCVGDSGDARKTASINIATSLLEEAFPGGAVGEEPGSPEKLVDALRENPRQLIPYGEFGAFLASTEKGYLMPLKTLLTKAWDGQRLGRSLVRKGRKETEAANPRLSLLAGCTMEYLERHTEPADWKGGFMARFLTFYAKRARTYTVPPGNPQGRAHLVAVLRHLNESSMFGVQRGTCLGFDPEARQLWDLWSASLSDEAGRSHDVTVGAVVRAHTHALRVALLLCWDYGMARSGQDFYITRAELEPAIAIVKLHIRSVQDIGPNLATSRDMRERRAVLKAIGEKPVDMGTVLTKSQMLKRRAQEILETLLEEGYIARVQGPEYVGNWYRLATEDEMKTRFIPKGVSLEQDANVIPFPQPKSGVTVENASSSGTGTDDEPVEFSPAAPVDDDSDNGAGGS